MRRLTFSVLFVFAQIVVHPVCLQAQDPSLALTEKEMAWMADNGSFTIAFDGDYAPYSWMNEQGEFVGIAVDFAHEITRRAGLMMDIYPSGVWKELYAATLEGEADIVATLAFREERLDHFIYTDPYISQIYYVTTRKGQDSIKRREDLAGATVALVEGYASSKAIEEEFPTLTPHYVSSTTEGIIAVSRGDADAVIGGLGFSLPLARAGTGEGKHVGHFVQPPELPVQLLHRLITGHQQAHLARVSLRQRHLEGGVHRRPEPSFGQLPLKGLVNRDVNLSTWPGTHGSPLAPA